VEVYQSAIDLVGSCSPVEPVLCRRPTAATHATNWFCNQFPGKTFYAVKANPSPWLIGVLGENGIGHFDVASIAEVRLLRRLAPQAELAFMNPVKSEEAIAEAYFRHGVRI
jgi:ornithine decarboxylase